MHKKILKIAVIFITAIFCAETSVWCAENGFPDESEWILFEKINEARLDPLGYAESLGMDREKILNDFPEDKDWLENGMPPLRFNVLLYESAVKHLADMFTDSYYSSTSSDGKTVEDRMIEAGYIPSVSGETLGMLFFVNFLPESNALDILFENMFKDELDLDYTGPKNILNPDFQDVGVAVGSGRWTAASGSYNSYLVTLDFASYSESPLEKEILAVINYLRKKPFEFASLLQIDKTKFEKLFFQLSQYEEGLPPLIPDSRIYYSAKGNAVDFIDNGFFADGEWVGKTVEERISDTNYPVAHSNEFLSASSTAPNVDGAQAAKEILYQRIGSDFKADNVAESLLMNPYYDNIGVFSTVVEMQSEENNEDGPIYHFLAIDLAKARLIVDNEIIEGEQGLQQRYLYCGVFEDANDNGLYDIGEGLKRVNVDIFSENAGISVKTDESGTVVIPVEGPGVYNVIAEYRGDYFQEIVEVDRENASVWFKFSNN